MSYQPSRARLLAGLTPLAVAVFLLCCTLGVLLGARTAHAQAPGGGRDGQTSIEVGAVNGLTITTDADGTGIVTTPVNKDATFTATASPGTPKLNEEWVTSGWTIVDGSATYQWTIATGAPATSPPTLPLTYSPTNTAKTTITVPQGSPARTDGYIVTITCAVTYAALGPDKKQPGTLTSSISKTIKVYIIGGPITGDSDEYFFCSNNLPGGSIDALGYLYATPGQPAGTTYSWSISGSAIYCDGDGNATTPTGASAKYCGTLPGSAGVGDVTANVTYSLNGVSAKSSPDWKIIVHVPKTFTILSKTPAVPFAYGFSGQTITFEVRDSVKQLYPQGKAYWSESWQQDKTLGGGQPAHYGGGPLDKDSRSVDGFASGDGLSAPSDPNSPYGDKILGPLTHVYAITHMGGTGGLIGCSIQTYTDVYYYTYQMTGNGFAPKGP